MKKKAAENKNMNMSQNFEITFPYTLCLQNVPFELRNEYSLYDLCSEYGNVVFITTTPPMYQCKFVSFETLDDLQNAIVGLAKNEYGIKVRLAHRPITAHRARNVNQPHTSELNKSKVNEIENQQQEDRSSINIQNYQQMMQNIQQSQAQVEPQQDLQKPKKDIHKLKQVTQKFQQNLQFVDINGGIKTDCITPFSISERKYCAHFFQSANVVCKYCGGSHCSYFCPNFNWERYYYNCSQLIVFEGLRTSGMSSTRNNTNNLLTSASGSTDTSIFNKFLINILSNSVTPSLTEEKSVMASIIKRCQIDKEISVLHNHSLLQILKLPKSESRVVVCSIIPNKMHFVFVMTIEHDEFLSVIDKIDKEARQSKQLSQLPKINDIVAIDFVGLGYYRAIVLDVQNENTILIMYIDVGVVVTKKLKEMKDISNDSKSLPRYVVPVYLRGVSRDVKPNKAVMDYLHDLTYNHPKILKIVYDQLLNGGCITDAELIDNKGKSINKKIIELVK